MGYKFRLKLVLRIVIIAVFMFAFIFAVYQEKWYVTSISCFLVFISLLIELVYFLELTNRELSKFLLSIKHKDFLLHYNTSGLKKKSSLDLRRVFNEIINEFQDVRIEKELHYQYLQTVFSHSKTAIICFDLNGKVQLVNDATRRLLDIKQLKKLDDLKRVNEELFKNVQLIRPDREKLLKIKIGQDLLHISLQCTIFKLKDQSYKMVSLHDVKAVLEEQELDSWKKLIRVLNHEIMNSVTPISSLSSALNKMLNQNENQKNLSAEDMQDLVESLKTIENRSKGLLKFVTNYKKITKLPQPNYTNVNINGLINHVARLLKPRFQEQEINLELYCPEEIKIEADHELIEQVIINLLLNAIESFGDQENKKVSIHVRKGGDNTFIEVCDNGSGIPDDMLDQIFIPFCTTKKTGSGIGLSLSKQIMQLHRGNLSVNSKLGSGSTFILRFP